jgi:protein tyrosine phosphatase (PTP) superfamily phosphohydrolase (DUF442 family)
MMKRLVKLFALTLVAAIAYYLWFFHDNYNFEAISENKVYKSGAIPPEKIGDFITENEIKVVIDLRHAGLKDKLNPGTKAEIDAEAKAVAQIEGVRHINIPSGQVPTEKTLSRFYEVLDDSANYPVLIHCHHGTGRAEIYSALYRIEYENWDNEAARNETRAVVEFAGYRSSFADGKAKGDFLINYKPRTRDTQIVQSSPSSG